jgi:Tfp pilus assembly protein PilF
MEVFVSIRLSRPLLSPAESAASTMLSLTVDRLLSLPARWLADVNELDAEKERARVEAEVQIAAWKKKGSKKPPPPAKKDEKKKSDKEKAPANEKKASKERAREAELKAVADRLNSQWRFGVSLSLPLGNGQSFVMSESCDDLELPVVSSPTSPSFSALAVPDALDLPADLSPRPSSGVASTQNSARKVGGKGGESNRSTASTAGVGAAPPNKAKTKKAEEERLAREAAEQAESAATKLAGRMARRSVPFRVTRNIFLTAAGVATLRELTTRGAGIPIILWRELVSIDPTVPPGVIQRDELIGSSILDLHALLKPGSLSLSSDVSVRLDAGVFERLEAEAIRAAQASEAVREDGAASPALSDDKDRRKSSIKKSGRGKERSKDEAPVTHPTGPPTDPYAAAHTTLSLRVQMTQPLVPLVIKPVLSLNDIIPLRTVSPPPRPTPDVELSEEIVAFVKQLAVEYEQIATQIAHQQDGADGAQQQAEQVTAALLYRLNASGMYHALRERLKPVIMKLHREGRKREVPSEAASARVTFDRRVSRLYTEMVDRLHVTLNELFHPARHAKPTTVTFIPTLPEPLQIVPDVPYEDKIDMNGFATELRSAIQNQLQAEIGSEGVDASSRLAILAQEAELQGDYPRAATLHQSRCLLEYQSGRSVSAAATASYWYDFACFQLRLRNFRSARTALRHSLAVEPTFEKSILALAALSIESRDLDTAEVLLRTYQSGGYSEGQFQFFILQALHAEAIEEPQQAANALAQAQSLIAPAPIAASDAVETDATSFTLSLVSPAGASTVESNSALPVAAPPAVPGTAPTTVITLPDDFKLPPPQAIEVESVWIRASKYLLGLGLTGLTSAVLKKEVADTPLKAIQLARLTATRIGVGPYDETDDAINALYAEAESYLSHAIATGVDYGQVIDAFAIRGHLFYQQGQFDAAVSAYETYQDWEPSQFTHRVDSSSISLPSVSCMLTLPFVLFRCVASLDPLLLYRLAVFYLRSGSWLRSRDVFLQLCSCAPSAVSWLGVGECSMELNESASSEQSLIQANRFDKSHANIWARLTIVALRNHRTDLAHQALIQAMKLHCTQPDLFRTIGGLYRDMGFIDLAVSTLERSVALRDSAQIRLDLAEAYLQQQSLEVAAQQLQRADQLAEDADTKATVHTRWNSLQKQIGRQIISPQQVDTAQQPLDAFHPQQQQQQQNGLDVATPAF